MARFRDQLISRSLSLLFPGVFYVKIVSCNLFQEMGCFMGLTRSLSVFFYVLTLHATCAVSRLSNLSGLYKTII